MIIGKLNNGYVDFALYACILILAAFTPISKTIVAKEEFAAEFFFTFLFFF